MITRSNTRPTTPTTAIATRMAGSTASRLRSRRSLPVQLAINPSIAVARKAPRVMKTPWPKLSTSIRPNTSVRPEAMMKMIIPIARPANVSVTHVENDPVSGSARSGSRSGLTVGRASSRAGAVVEDVLIRAPSSLMGRQRQAQQVLLQDLVAGEFGHGARVHDPAAVHHRDAVSELACKIEVLLHEQDGGVGPFEFTEGPDHVLDDGRRQTLARFVDEQQLPGLDDGARPRQHLFP